MVSLALLASKISLLILVYYFKVFKIPLQAQYIIFDNNLCHVGFFVNIFKGVKI